MARKIDLTYEKFDMYGENEFITSSNTPSGLTIKDMDILDRPIEKMAYYGKFALTDAELLAILLGSGTRELTALELANRILTCIKSIDNILDLDLDELKKIKGIGSVKAARIVAALELGNRFSKRRKRKLVNIDSPHSVADYLYERFRDEKREHFLILLLDTKNQIISEVEVSVGDLNKSIVNPREVFKPAVKKSANSIILVHNHPSGDVKPSKEDINVTYRLLECSKIIGISILDHLIIGNDAYCSMREDNIINWS